MPQVAKAAPLDFLHMEQWQLPTKSNGAVTSYVTAPQRQLPLMDMRNLQKGLRLDAAPPYFLYFA